MKHHRRSLGIFFLSAALLCAVDSSAADVPALIPIQGELANDAGPVDGTHDLTLRVFTVEAGGSPLHTETHNAVDVDQGQFVAYLGDGTSNDPLSLGLFEEHDELWLEVVIDGTEVLEPRFRLGSVPYAAQALACGEAEHALSADEAKEATHAATATKANEAAHATNADEAKHAVAADKANQCTLADSATKATSAAKADLATKAETATKADSATKADTAASAGVASNADKLGNKDPSAYTYAAGSGLLMSNNIFSIKSGGVSANLLASNMTYGSNLTVSGKLIAGADLDISGKALVGYQRRSCSNTDRCSCTDNKVAIGGGATPRAYDAVVYSTIESATQVRAVCNTPQRPSEGNKPCASVEVVCARLGD